MSALRVHAPSNPVILLEVPAGKQVTLAKKIKGLGGKYIDSKIFEKNATHLVCDKVTCSEKFLGACIKGLWVVSSKFIEDSFNEGHWLKEDDYEVSVYDNSSSRHDRNLVLAARRWRWKVSLFQEQPFNGWHVALALEFSKLCVYNRLLVYGGASIISLPAHMSSENVQNITYVFLDPSSVHLANQLLEYGLLGLTEKFIIDTIIKDDILDPFDYIISNNSLSHCYESQLLHYEEKHTDHLVETEGADFGPILNTSDLKIEIFRQKILSQATMNYPVGQSNYITSISQKRTVSIKNVPMEKQEDILEMVSGLLPLEEGYGGSETSLATSEKTFGDCDKGKSEVLPPLKKPETSPATSKKTFDDCDKGKSEVPPPLKKLHIDLSGTKNLSDTDCRMRLDKVDNSKLAVTPGSSLHPSRKSFDRHLHNQTSKKPKRSIATDENSVLVESEENREDKFPELGLPESTKLNKSLNMNIYLYGPSFYSNSGIGQSDAKLTVNRKDGEHLQGKSNLLGVNGLSHIHEKRSDSSSGDELSNHSTKRMVKETNIDIKRTSRDLINKDNLISQTLTSALQCEDPISSPKDSRQVKNIQHSHSKLESWSHTIRMTLTPNIYIHGLSQVSSASSDNISKAVNTKQKMFKKNREAKKMRRLETQNQDNPTYLSCHVDEKKLLKTTSHSTDRLVKKCKPKPKPLHINRTDTAESPDVSSKSLYYQQNVNASKSRKTSSESPLSESRDKLLSTKETNLFYKSGTSSISSATESVVCFENVVTSAPVAMSSSDKGDSKSLTSKEVKKEVVQTTKPLLTLPPNPYIHGFQTTEKSLTKSESQSDNHSKVPARASKKDENKSHKFSKKKGKTVKCRSSKVLSQLNTSQPLESTPKKTQLSLQDFGFSSSYKRGLKREISVEDSPKSVQWSPMAPTRRNLMRINLDTLITSPIISHESPTTHSNHLFRKDLLNSPASSVDKLPASSIETNDRMSVALNNSNDLINDDDPMVFALSMKSELSESHVLKSFDKLKPSQKKGKKLSGQSKNIFSLMNEMCITSDEKPSPHPIEVSQGCTSFPLQLEDEYIDWNSKIKSASLSPELKEIFNTYCVRKSERVQERKKKKLLENGVISEDDNSAPEEPLTFHKSSGLTFSYPIGVDPGLYKACPEINDLYGEWMQSARGFDFYNMSCNHATPRADRRPTALLIKELVLLLQCPEAMIRDKANFYLREWLALHPPVTPETIKLYTEAFSLSPNNTFIIERIRSCMENPEPLIAVWLVEFCVLMFEINFDHCLKQGSKKVLQSSMITKWLWISPHSVFYNSSTSQLVKLLEEVIISPEPNVPLCVALCSLISMAAQCVRLASVQWNPENPNFVSDPVLDISYDLAKRIQHCFSVQGFDAGALVIGSLNPCWLRTLVIAVILSSYNNYLLSERIVVNKISLSSIVSQYFFLVPPLQECSITERSLMSESGSNHSDKSSASSLSDAICPSKRNGQLNSKHKTLKVNKRNGHGESAVHVACKKNKVEMLQQLLTVPGVDVNLRDHGGWTPLHEACNHGSYDCVMLLLKYVPNTTISGALEQGDHTACKVDLNAVGPEGVTPLIDAVQKNHVKICRQLLKYGGQQLLKAKNAEGWTALELAYTPEMRKLLNDVNLSDSVLELDLGSSQESLPLSVSTDIQSIHETAPLSSLYEEVIGAKYVLEKDCSDFLSLLTSLVSSYYMSMPSQPPNYRLIGLHERDASVLLNMKGHMKLLRRHIKKLMKPDDYKSLFFQIELLELVCLSKF